jgi:hypothetical protein
MIDFFVEQPIENVIETRFDPGNSERETGKTFVLFCLSAKPKKRRRVGREGRGGVP